MARRQKMKRSKDKAIFKRTAQSVAAANIPRGSNSYRGGIRL